MTASKLSDETLMAYADGELPDVEADAVTVAAALDPEVARRVALFKASSRIAKAALDPVLGEAVPPHLREAVLALGTHASGRKRAPRRSWLDWLIPEGSVTPWAGVAAALGCVLGIAVGWQLASLRSVPGAAPSLAASVAPLPAELLGPKRCGPSPAARTGSGASRPWRVPELRGPRPATISQRPAAGISRRHSVLVSRFRGLRKRVT